MATLGAKERRICFLTGTTSVGGGGRTESEGEDARDKRINSGLINTIEDAGVFEGLIEGSGLVCMDGENVRSK